MSRDNCLGGVLPEWHSDIHGDPCMPYTMLVIPSSSRGFRCMPNAAYDSGALTTTDSMTDVKNWQLFEGKKMKISSLVNGECEKLCDLGDKASEEVLQREELTSGEDFTSMEVTSRIPTIQEECGSLPTPSDDRPKNLLRQRQSKLRVDDTQSATSSQETRGASASVRKGMEEASYRQTSIVTGLSKSWRSEVLFLSLALLCVVPVSGGFDRGGLHHQITWGRGNSPPGSAVFGNSPTNVTAVLGHRARLPCQVKNLGLKDVSWIRQRDLHILTVGIFTYTSDDRFKVFHPHETEDWFLDISSVTFRDSGIYECQVSTSPKVSLPIYLTVLGVQEADIPGPYEVFIQHGSTISLQCEVQAGVEAVGPVHWLKGADTLNYSSPRGGISMEVEKTPTKTMSKLYITRAGRADSGNYTCAPLFAKPDSVLVHVVNAGEESAAAVHSGGIRYCDHNKTIPLWAAILLPVSWLFLKWSPYRL